MSARYTSELANGLGNLASRATAMVNRYCEGSLPTPGAYTPAEQALIDMLAQVAPAADAAVEELDFSTAIGHVRGFIEAVNGYVTDVEPWVLAKDPENAQRLHTVLYTTCECLRAIAVLYNPVMPAAMESMWQQIGGSDLGPLGEQRIDAVATWGQLPPGARITKGDALFPRLEDADAG
jgi:methionyl-tRNA synthetase